MSKTITAGKMSMFWTYRLVLRPDAIAKMAVKPRQDWFLLSALPGGWSLWSPDFGTRRIPGQQQTDALLALCTVDWKRNQRMGEVVREHGGGIFGGPKPDTFMGAHREDLAHAGKPTLAHDPRKCPSCDRLGTPQHDAGSNTVYRCEHASGCDYEDSWLVPRKAPKGRREWFVVSVPFNRPTCRTCGERYAEGGDGWDGECGNCADRSSVDNSDGSANRGQANCGCQGKKPRRRFGRSNCAPCNDMVARTIGLPNRRRGILGRRNRRGRRNESTITLRQGNSRIGLPDLWAVAEHLFALGYTDLRFDGDDVVSLTGQRAQLLLDGAPLDVENQQQLQDNIASFIY